MTILLSWSRRLPLSVRWLRASQYGWVTSLRFVLPGQPSWQYLMIVEHTGSACSRSLRVVWLAGSSEMHASMAIWASSSRLEASKSPSVVTGERESVSAVYMCLPGVC